MYPNNVPAKAKQYIESSMKCFADQNFGDAYQFLNESYQIWCTEIQKNELSHYHQLFYEYQKGQIFLSTNRHDLALSQFYAAKQLSEKLPSSNPDCSIPYSGIGSCLYKMQEYKLALRSFLLVTDFSPARSTSCSSLKATVRAILAVELPLCTWPFRRSASAQNLVASGSDQLGGGEQKENYLVLCLFGRSVADPRLKAPLHIH